MKGCEVVDRWLGGGEGVYTPTRPVLFEARPDGGIGRHTGFKILGKRFSQI